jgi:hypothetical protein
VDNRARLNLPDDLELFAKGVIFDGGQLHDVLRRPGNCIQGRRGKRVGSEIRDDESTAPDFDELADFRNLG